MVAQLKRKSEVLNDEFSRTKAESLCISTPEPSIQSLPQDLLIEILGKVAASSFTDLFNAKLVAKDFLEASEDGHIFRHVSLRNLQKVPWKNNNKFCWFMKNCNKNGNAEALYRHGMLKFFSYCKEASGLANLKVAAQKGHADASYVYGVVLYLSSERLKFEQGLEFLKRCEAKLGVQMAECRRRVKEFVGSIWINNKIFSPEQEDFGGRRSCDCKNYNKRSRNGWDWKDEDDNYGQHTCEACKWNGEVLRFCNMLRTGSYN